MDNEIECAFCGRLPEEVDCYVQGPYVLICSLCVDLCAKVVEDERSNQEDE
jgi:ATP-dependent protease Clp ATPase subunit